MDTKNNGGPAFPKLDRLDSPSHEYTAYSTAGMTLRDYFAAKAMSGMLADPDLTAAWEDIAKASYKMADAMLAERTA